LKANLYLVAAMALAAVETPGIAAAKSVQEDAGQADAPTLPGGRWKVHDPDRPQPPVITPGSASGMAPSDAVVLFDGGSIDAWTVTGRPWIVQDGVMTVPPFEQGKAPSALISRQAFGDIQLHLEFRMPNPPQEKGQHRGNSGIFFMGRYELQILDGYRNPTYADGTVGAIYGWNPPLVNPSRMPGEWQSYDVIFERPRFAADGSLRRPAYVTAFLNGVLVQNRQAFLGATVWNKIAKYEAHGDAAPLQLQDHASPVSFRNIWVRPLPNAALSYDPNPPPADTDAAH
jgi:Domain of Unknown Function (DUF1080)